MRWFLIFALLLLGNAGRADPDQRYCSSTKWGHAHCIRPAHFVYDTCNATKVFSDRHGLNRDFFARLIWQESRFDQNALSHANARGIAQFIPSTAALRGLKDPYNPADALEHSAQYLAEMVGKYGNEGMAAIGYNGGERRAEGFLQGKGLAPETVNYVPIITGLAAEIWRDTPPKAPDFRLSKDAPFLPACYMMAASRRITPLKLTPPPPVLKPWGVQVAFGTSKRAAQSKAASNMSSCRATVKGRKLDMLSRVRAQRVLFCAIWRGHPHKRPTALRGFAPEKMYLPRGQELAQNRACAPFQPRSVAIAAVSSAAPKGFCSKVIPASIRPF